MKDLGGGAMQETLTGDLEDTLDCPNLKTIVVALESSILL